MTNFPELESFLAGGVNPQGPDAAARHGVWVLAFQKVRALMATGLTERRAKRLLIKFLFRHAPWLASSRHSLRCQFDYKLAKLKAANWNFDALRDGREENGGGYEMALKEIESLRTCAALECGKRINAAWIKKYDELSDATREYYPDRFRCPAKVYKQVNRDWVDFLYERHCNGLRGVRNKMGGILRSWEGIPSMHSFVVDDVTSNIEVVFGKSLILPQIIAVMDGSSRKIVDYSISDDKAPTAALVCDAVLDAFRRNNIPKELWVENGFVFGKSLLVNGKKDDMGRNIVAGLGPQQV